MDTLEINKILSGVLGAALVLLLLNWVSSEVYGTAAEGHDDHHELAFEIELPDTGEEEMVVADVGPTIHEALLEYVGVEVGDNVFRACSACHKVEEGVNGTGPYLYNVVGRDIASVSDFGYSDALMSIDGVWNAEALSGFLESPRNWAPGTSMGYNGMRDVEDRAATIAYLVQQSGQNLEDFIVVASAVDEAPVEEAPAEEMVTEEAMTEEAPAAEEAPVEEAPAEEAPAEEAPAEEEAALDAAGDENAAVEAAEVEAEADAAADAADVVVTDAPVTTELPAAEGTSDTDTITETEADVIAETNAPEAAETDETVVETAGEQAPEAEQAPAEEAAPVEEAPVEEEAPAEEAAADVPAFMVNASAENGEGLFRACRACHVLDEGVNRQGPSLYQIVGRDIGAIDGFRYSSAMAEKGGVWDYESLNGFLEAPRDWLPGTRMGYAGMRDQQDRADLIAYLEASGQ